MSEEGKGLAGTVGYKENVDVAGGRFLSSGEGAEEPCLQDGLRLEVVGYGLLHLLGVHKLKMFNSVANIHKVSEMAVVFLKNVQKDNITD